MNRQFFRAKGAASIQTWGSPQDYYRPLAEALKARFDAFCIPKWRSEAGLAFTAALGRQTWRNFSSCESTREAS